jgi:hypothetical protein
MKMAKIPGLQNGGPKQHQDLSLGIQLVVTILIRFMAHYRVIIDGLWR